MLDDRVCTDEMSKGNEYVGSRKDYRMMIDCDLIRFLGGEIPESAESLMNPRV